MSEEKIKEAGRVLDEIRERIPKMPAEWSEHDIANMAGTQDDGTWPPKP